MTPDLSIIITTHHRPALLRRAIRSVLAQEGTFEILVCADEASEETRQVALEELRSQDRFVCLPDLRGPSGTRNAGVRLAKGRFVCFLDDDDTFLPGYFTALEAMRPADACVTYCNYVALEETGRDTASPQEVSRRDFDQSRQEPFMLKVRNIFPMHSLVFPREVFGHKKSGGGFDESLSSHEDWDFLIRISTLSPFRHVAVSGAVYHLSSDTSRNSVEGEKLVQTYKTIYRRYPSLSLKVWTRRRRRIRKLRKILRKVS